MRRWTVCAALAFGITALGVAACSDDEERLSTEEFLEQGNAICAEGNEETDEEASGLFEDEEPTPEEISAFVIDVLEPNVTEQIDALDELQPPEELEDDVDELLEAARGAIDGMVELAEDDPEAIFFGEDPFVPVDELALEIGLDECADA